jgi:hypothetical protein
MKTARTITLAIHMSGENPPRFQSQVARLRGSIERKKAKMLLRWRFDELVTC